MEVKTMETAVKSVVFGQAAHYSSHRIFESVGRQRLEGLSLAVYNPHTVSQVNTADKGSHESAAVTDPERKLMVADCMTCSCCQAFFVDRSEQLAHYKCDWHRYNLHRRLKGLSFVTEDEFEAAAGDVSSISGSDDEDENYDATTGPTSGIPVAETPEIEDERNSVLPEWKFHKVFFATQSGELVSLYRCVLHHKKNPLYEADSILDAVNKLKEKNRWIILMVSAGHFAGAVFHGNDVVDHKTFHRYTVRAKRGTAQSTKDGNGGAPKSAGATLRRYNEAALVQDVQDLLAKWEDHIKSCDFVFSRIPVANRAMFFGGKNPAFKKDDPRIRMIPFPTRRPTFSEAKRVHQMLASVECYGNKTEIGDIIPLSPPRVHDKDSESTTLRESIHVLKHARGKNHRRSPHPQSNHSDVVLTALTQGQDSCELNLDDSDDHEEVTEVDLAETLEEIDFSDLKMYDCSTKKKHTKKKKLPSANTKTLLEETPFDKEVTEWRNSLYTACKTGCLDSVQTLLEKSCPKFKAFCVRTAECLQSADSDITKNPQYSQNTETICNQLLSSPSDALKGDEDNVQPGDLTKPSHDQHPAQSRAFKAETSEAQPLSYSVADFLNLPLSDDGNTFLHVASKEGYSDTVTVLLYAGADPAVKNKAGKTPYNLGESEVRNAFRRFMAKCPEQYDYIKAQIPSPLTAEMEADKKHKTAEKRKAKKKALLERNKEKKAVEAKIRTENEEKGRFLALSDREKRALAAERRFIQQSNDQGALLPVLSRCWQCGTDITGKVPFEYSDYKFCTTKCLREHRSRPSDQKLK